MPYFQDIGGSIAIGVFSASFTQLKFQPGTSQTFPKRLRQRSKIAKANELGCALELETFEVFLSTSYTQRV